MASFPIFSLCTLILLVSLLPHASLAHSSNPKDIPSSPFNFLKNLQGCHKGEKVKGLHVVKKYLKHFGYLSYQNQSLVKSDHFDDLLESAIKTYQLNYHLNITGVLDHETVSKMTKPRCGVADIINGRTRMLSGREKRHSHGSISFHKVSPYSFFPGSPRWRPSKYQLRYAFLPGYPSEFMNPVARAFRTWDANTHFTFNWIQDYRYADITIGFRRGYHDDNSPFDGRGGKIAHAYAPEVGVFHYDADETWSVSPRQDAFHLETVALHEMGHLLGLDHSSVQQAIMYPYIELGSVKGLQNDDVQGIRALYNV